MSATEVKNSADVLKRENNEEVRREGNGYYLYRYKRELPKRQSPKIDRVAHNMLQLILSR